MTDRKIFDERSSVEMTSRKLLPKTIVHKEIFSEEKLNSLLKSINII